jgi:ATP-dependent DNA helicase RecG
MRYEDRSNLTTIDKLYDGIEASLEIHTNVSAGFPVGKNRDPRKPKLFLFEITGTDASRRNKPVAVKWFVSGKAATQIIAYYEERFTRGTRFVAHGRWEFEPRRGIFTLKITKPEELEVLPEIVANAKQSHGNSDNVDSHSPSRDSEPEEESDDDLDPRLATIHNARKVPVYRKFGPFPTTRLREIIYSVLESLDPSSVEDPLPEELLKEEKLIGRFRALKEIHFPPDDSQISDYDMARSAAHKRLIFEEFFWLSFALRLKRGERMKEPKGTVIEIPRSTKQQLIDLFPFTLTNAQNRVIKAIFEDMQSDAPMNRLIQGDVGSGKTIVAFAAMFAAMENGYQAALMAPTEILAEQHVRNAKRFFSGTDFSIELLTGSVRSSDKKKLHAGIAAGEINAVIGTQAVIQDAVKFRKLGLAVIDEQHRFGVLQRAAIRALGFNPDILVMTATPIPRSLAMTVYGDLEVSIIDEMPPGRTPVKTVVVGEDQRIGVYKGIEREINLGRQAYIVYPLIEESQKLDLKAATLMYEELRDRIFPHLKVGLLHGKMKPAEKEAIMAEFVSGSLNILVSTTVIEVGVDVSNASLMVVEHAERFGLSQLHQLRGRVGRGAEQSFCVLLTGDKKTTVARERLGIMERTNDGFKIAEKDLEIRGEGEILGTRQSGIQNFKIGNLVRDIDLLSEARRVAEEYLTEKRSSPETARMIKFSAKSGHLRFGGIG